MFSPASRFLATRLIVSSARSSGKLHPRHWKNFISLRRRASYFVPASRRSASSCDNNRSNAPRVKVHLFFGNDGGSTASPSLRNQRGTLRFRTLAQVDGKRISEPDLIPFALELKCAPEIGILLPSLLLPHVDLRGPPRHRWRLVLLQDALVKQRHQFSRSNIIDLPQARYHPRCPGVHESTGQPDQSFPLDL